MKRLFILLFCLPLLSSCVEQQIIDQLNIETAQGYDLAEENRLKGTILYSRYLPDKSVQNETLTAVGAISRDVLMSLERQSSDPIVTGGVQVVLFNKELARHGFMNMIDGLQRDPNIGSRILLAVVEGSTEELLQQDYGFKGSATYIHDLLIHNMKKRDVPLVNLHLFGSYFMEKGRDTYLPIIKLINDKQDIKITGIALFKKEKLVKEISGNKMFYFKLLVDKYSEGTTNVNNKGKESVIRSIHSKNKIKIDKSKSPLEAVIYIEVRAVVREYSGKNVQYKVVKELETSMEKQIKKECMKMLKSFQKEGIDPAGIGLRVKNTTRNFDFSKWDDQYKTITFKVVPKVTITESGTVE